MKSILILLGACGLAAALPSARAAVNRVVEKSFAVSPGGRLTVSTEGGNIRVEPGSGDTVHVVARERIRAGSDAEADEILKNLVLTLEQAGSDVTATARYDRKDGGSFWRIHFGSWPPVEVDFEVTVPSAYSAEVRTSGGNIRIGDLKGTVRARTSGGNVALGNISGRVDAETSGGNVSLAAGGADARLSTSGGNVTLGPVAGQADVRTSGGDISIAEAGGPVDARTSGGDVSVHFAGPLKGDCSLGTSGGRVRAFVPQGVGYVLDASTSGGRVRAEGVTIAPGGERNGHSTLRGTVGSGGPALRLRSSGGDVDIETPRS